MSELLRLQGVSKRYRRGAAQLRVLDGVSLELAAGELACVLASRGQGKTTLLRIAAGMTQPDEGRVLLEGREITGLSDSALSALLGSQIAWAGASGPGMPMRMLDYVAMPLLVRARRGWRRRHAAKRDAYAKAGLALERVGAIGSAEQQWDQMSDWERALVEIAQAMAPEPRLLLVDDLTDTLGIRETDELCALIRDLCRERGIGVLQAVSDGQAALLADRILTLSAGALTQAPQPDAANVIELPTLGAGRSRGHGGL